ncbi:MAG TPA: MBG domain-containing protein, partial [Bryobacteraceae bacterium]
MAQLRSGHSASLLSDGRVLIAGGQNTNGPANTLEIFSPSTNSFTLVTSGTLSSARTKHAAAVLADGRVLIAGGSDGTNALKSVDIFDPSSGNVSPAASMAMPRAGLSATTLLDGTVLVAGGNNGSADLVSAEKYDPAAGSFSGTGNLSAARSGQLAFLLPNNNEVLIAGGTSAGAPLATAELFVPWTGSFTSTGAMAIARTAAAGGPLKQNGQLLVAGGSDGKNPLASSELYNFATITTDKSDYPPGTTVNISGSGWQPGETVTLTLVESPLYDTHGPYTAVADSNGNIFNNQFATDAHDANIRFYLTAKGSVSQAQMTFTDAINLSTLDGTCTTSTASFTLGQTVCAKATGLGGSDSYDIRWFDPSGALQSTSTSSTAGNLTDTFQPASSGNWTVKVFDKTTSTVVGTITFAVTGKTTATITLANLTQTYDGTPKSATATTNPAGLTVTFTYNGSSTAPTNAGTYTVIGTVQEPNYQGNATGTLKISPATPTVTVTGGTFTYDGAAHGAGATAKGVGGATVSGTFAFTYSPGSTTPVNAGTYTVTANFTSTDANYTNATGAGSLTINAVAPTITWANPAAIPYGTALGAAQLNATASVQGTFSYAPAAGTILKAGSQNLSVTFTPADTTNYSAVTKTVQINVTQATTSVVWPTPADISYGTALSSTQ